MQAAWDLQGPQHDSPRRAISGAEPDDDAPLPPELDTCVLERTAQLQKINQELEAFSWSVSHDLTAPLLQLHAHLRFLKTHPGAGFDHIANEHLVGIQSCADRMSRLTQDLFRLA